MVMDKTTMIETVSLEIYARLVSKQVDECGYFTPDFRLKDMAKEAIKAAQVFTEEIHALERGKLWPQAGPLPNEKEIPF